MVENKDGKIAEVKVPSTEKPKEPAKVKDAKSSQLIKLLKTATPEELNIARDILGIKSRISSGVRVTGKVKGTGKKLEIRVAKQVEVLIKSLPKDKAVDIKEWANLAVKAGLETQQPPERIVAYYKRQIVQLGFAVAIA